jgi:hypothetical protein
LAISILHGSYGQGAASHFDKKIVVAIDETGDEQIAPDIHL